MLKINRHWKNHSYLRLAMICIVCLLLLALNANYNWTIDVSKNKKHSLSEASIELLRNLDAPLEFKVFLDSQNKNNTVLKHKITNFFQRLQYHKSDIHIQYLNAKNDWALAKKYRIQKTEEIIVLYKNEFKSITKLDESTVINALLQMSYKRELWVAFLEGHGEKSSTKELSQFAQSLKNRQAHVQKINLLRTPVIPRNTSLLVIAAPKTALNISEVSLILRYLNAGGNLLWLHDPGHSLGMELIANRLGINVLPGVILDSHLADKSAAHLVINRYAKNHIIGSTLQGYNSVYPVSSALQKRKNNSAKSFTYQPIITTSVNSWNETQLQTSKQYDANSQDQKGPLVLSFALTRRINSKDQRVIISGDSDFLTNRYINNGVNKQFALNLFSWLSYYDDMINVQQIRTIDLPLKLTYQQILYQALIFAFILPFLLFLFAYFIPRRRLLRS